MRALALVRHLLLRHLEKYPALVCVDRMVGPSPSCTPPSRSWVSPLLAELATLWGLTYNDVLATHPASPLRYQVFAQLLALTGDPDVEIATWLRDGAPYFGIENPIRPGGHFPRLLDRAPISPRQLLKNP